MAPAHGTLVCTAPRLEIAGLPMFLHPALSTALMWVLVNIIRNNQGKLNNIKTTFNI